MNNERIKLTDTLKDILVKMSDGNPGAVTTLIEMISPNTIDTDSLFGGHGKILQLDALGIYGTDIYVLYNDICERDLVKMYTVLRSVQLGLFDGKIVKDAAGRQDRSGVDMIPIDELYVKVKEILPDFNSK